MFPCLGIQPRWFRLLNSDLIWIFLLTYFVLTDVGCSTINKINSIMGSLGTIIGSICEFTVLFKFTEVFKFQKIYIGRLNAIVVHNTGCISIF